MTRLSQIYPTLHPSSHIISPIRRQTSCLEVETLREQISEIRRANAVWPNLLYEWQTIIYFFGLFDQCQTYLLILLLGDNEFVAWSHPSRPQCVHMQTREIKCVGQCMCCILCVRASNGPTFIALNDNSFTMLLLFYIL